MAKPRAQMSHEERTADEPRDHDIHLVNLSNIEEVNPTVRLLQLRVQDQERGLKVREHLGCPLVSRFVWIFRCFFSQCRQALLSLLISV